MQNSILPLLWCESVSFELTQPRKASWWMMPGFNVLTKVLFLLHLGGLEGFMVHKTVAWQDTIAFNHLAGSIVLIPLTAWRRGKELCLCVCTRLCSNCVDCMQPTERSVVWVMHCFSIGSDAQPPTWCECLQTGCSSLAFYYLEPAESGPKWSVVHHHSHPQHLHHIPNIYSKNHGLAPNNLCEVWICNHIQKGQIQ